MGEAKTLKHGLGLEDAKLILGEHSSHGSTNVTITGN
jgi:hypothetical protein